MSSKAMLDDVVELLEWEGPVFRDFRFVAPGHREAGKTAVMKTGWTSASSGCWMTKRNAPEVTRTWDQRN